MDVRPLDSRFGPEQPSITYANLRIPLHQVPEALQLRANDERARQAASHLPEMQVTGGGADLLDVLRPDGSQDLASLAEHRTRHHCWTHQPDDKLWLCTMPPVTPNDDDPPGRGHADQVRDGIAA